MTLDSLTTGLISGSMILPVGAAAYLIGGWVEVIATSVFGFLLGVAGTAWSAYRSVSKSVPNGGDK